MKLVLTLFGAATLIAGLGLGITEWANNPTIVWWMPMSYITGGLVGSVPWFALAAILSEIEGLRSEVKQLRA